MDEVRRAYEKHLETDRRAKRLDDLSKRLRLIGFAIFALALAWGAIGGALLGDGTFLFVLWSGGLLSVVAGVLISARFFVLALGEYRIMRKANKD